MKKRKICVAVLSRANYGRSKTILHQIQSRPELELQVIVGASANVERFGNVAKIIEADGFPISESLHFSVEGDSTLAMVQTCGLGIIQIGAALERLKPDVVVTIADRYETMATSIAATYQNICLAHVQGGEITGSIDESVRHAITKLANIHFPATEKSRENIIRLGEDPRFVHNVGCPSIDILKQYDSTRQLPSPLPGVGADIDLAKPYLLVVQHPVTSDYEKASAHVDQTISAVVEIGTQAIWLWPNIDAGADSISKQLRRLREKRPDVPIRFIKNLPVDDYNEILRNAACTLGNSSSFIREGCYLGTPGVIVGNRQNMREHGQNVLFVSPFHKEILLAIRKQLGKRYPGSALFGRGLAGARIAEILSQQLPATQKVLCYD
jgi:UDP-hydrolysing UDP-N-acetyl-D-glucosamine 2-epimerase